MASVNKAIVVGHLGRDPEVRSFPDGGQVATISVATTDKWKDKQSGQSKEATEWHRPVFHGRLAEIAAQYLRKGAQVYVEGSLRTRKWTDQNGVERYTTEIRAEQLKMLSRSQDGAPAGPANNGGEPASQRGQSNASNQAQAPAATPSPPNGDFEDYDDDIPF